MESLTTENSTIVGWVVNWRGCLLSWFAGAGTRFRRSPHTPEIDRKPLSAHASETCANPSSVASRSSIAVVVMPSVEFGNTGWNNNLWRPRHGASSNLTEFGPVQSRRGPRELWQWRGGNWLHTGMGLSALRLHAVGFRGLFHHRTWDRMKVRFRVRK